MKKNLFMVLFALLVASCAVKLVPIQNIMTLESKGLIVTVKEQNISFDKADPYTPIMVTIANNTEKKIKISRQNFMVVDENNNQFTSVPLDVIKKEWEDNKKTGTNRSCPPNCYTYQTPYNESYTGYTTSPYGLGLGGYGNPYSPPFYPYISSDPYLYYKDKDGNYQTVPQYSYPIYTIPNQYEEEDPTLMALRMEEIYPKFQIQGYVYFHQVTKFGGKKIKLLINVPGYTEDSLVFEFNVE